MAFFKQLESKRKPSSPIFKEMATRLRDTLKQHSLLKNRRVSINGWTHQFELLTVEGTTVSRIEEVLDWYLTHFKLQYVPKVFSGKSFRLKFQQIESSMSRIEQEVQVQSTQVDEHSLNLQKEMGLRWPGKEKEQEALTIQVSWDNISLLRQELRKIIQKDIKEPSSRGSHSWYVRRCAEEILTLIGDPRSYTEWWIREIHQIAWKWNGWKGNLEKWVFHKHNVKFLRLVQKQIHQFCGSEVNVQEFLGENEKGE